MSMLVKGPEIVTILTPSPTGFLTHLSTKHSVQSGHSPNRTPSPQTQRPSKNASPSPSRVVNARDIQPATDPVAKRSAASEECGTSPSYARPGGTGYILREGGLVDFIALKGDRFDPEFVLLRYFAFKWVRRLRHLACIIEVYVTVRTEVQAVLFYTLNVLTRLTEIDRMTTYH